MYRIWWNCVQWLFRRRFFNIFKNGPNLFWDLFIWDIYALRLTTVDWTVYYGLYIILHSPYWSPIGHAQTKSLQNFFLGASSFKCFSVFFCFLAINCVHVEIHNILHILCLAAGCPVPLLPIGPAATLFSDHQRCSEFQNVSFCLLVGSQTFYWCGHAKTNHQCYLHLNQMINVRNATNSSTSIIWI